MKFKGVPKVLRLLVGFGDKIELDLDFEFAPSCLDDFKGRGLDRAKRIGVSLMQLELYLLEPV